MHIRKTQVEECKKLSIFFMKPNLYPGATSGFAWYRGERKIGSVAYSVLGDDSPTAVKLSYTINMWGSDQIHGDCVVQLTTTPLPWGGVRYGFSCPLTKSGATCNRRVGCLYIPPNNSHFGCRHCYDLTYRSCQESHVYDNYLADFALSMQDAWPGVTGKDIQAILASKTTDNLASIAYKRFQWDWSHLPGPYANYLTVDEIAEQSGLSHSDVERLYEVRLLVPDHDGKYRPKLAGWAKKLAYLLGEGWELYEIKCWAKWRFQTDYTMQWPPDREDWL
jgi:hypothetical protein